MRELSNELQEQAAVFAEQLPCRENAAFKLPTLSGDLEVDITALSGLTKNDLIVVLDQVSSGQPNLWPPLRTRFEFLLEVSQALYPGLGQAGVGAWMRTGDPSMLEAIVSGNFRPVRLRLADYQTSIVT